MRKKRWKEDRRGGPANATYEQCPGSFQYPSHTMPSPEVWAALGEDVKERLELHGQCSICGKWLKVTRYSWIPRHKEQHERGWDR